MCVLCGMCAVCDVCCVCDVHCVRGWLVYVVTADDDYPHWDIMGPPGLMHVSVSSKHSQVEGWCSGEHEQQQDGCESW